MKKRLCSLLLVLTMLSTLLVAPASALEADGSTSVGNETYVYLGVKDYGTVEADSKPDFVHRFYTNGEEVQYTIASSDNKYAVQNKLQEGYVYDLTIEGGVVTDAAAATADAEGTIASIDDSTVTVNGAAVKYSAIYEISNNAAGATAVTKVTDLTALVGKTAKVYGDTVYLTFIAEPYTAPVSGTPGERTLKNYLQTAMNPVGTALYVYGGSWDWQDELFQPGADHWPAPELDRLLPAAGRQLHLQEQCRPRAQLLSAQQLEPVLLRRCGLLGLYWLDRLQRDAH